MNEVLDIGLWYIVPVGLMTVGVAFALLPGLILRLVVLAYPKDHPRRPEVLAEFYSIPYPSRVLFVIETCEMSVSEALPARLRSAKSSIDRRAVKKAIRVLSKEYASGDRERLIADLVEMCSDRTLEPRPRPK